MGDIKAERVVQKLEVQGRLIHTSQKPTKNSRRVTNGVTLLTYRLDCPTSFEYTLSDTAIDENFWSLYGGPGLLISTQTSNSSMMGLISPTRFFLSNSLISHLTTNPCTKKTSTIAKALHSLQITAWSTLYYEHTAPLCHCAITATTRIFPYNYYCYTNCLKRQRNPMKKRLF